MYGDSRRRAFRGLWGDEDPGEPCKAHPTEPKPMPGASMRRDGYDVLGRRDPKYGIPGDIEENYADELKDDMPFGPISDDY